MDLKKRAKQLKTDIPAVLIAIKHPETSLIAKIFGGLTVVYALSPIDLVPDFIPVLGYLDDIILLPLFIVITLKFIPKEIFEKCQIEAKERYQDTNLKHWYYGIPILLIWVVIISYVIKIFV